MSLNLALSSALSGLQTSQKGLDLVSRNIANVNTVGYTKKIFNQESRVLAGQGAGVQAGEITRRIDTGLIHELNIENAKLTEYSVNLDYYQRMQDTFGKPSDNNSVAHILEKLAAEVESLALEPDKTEQHLTVVQRAEDVTNKLNDMSDRIQRLRLDADEDIERSIDEVNTLLNDIQILNEEISYSIATARDATDLRDQRDQAIKELSALMDITTFERNSGELTVYTRGGNILVDREVKQISHTSLASINPWDTKGGEDINGILLGAEDITDDISEGKLAALINLRDTILPDTQAQIDELSAQLRDTVNQVNNRGTSYPNLASSYVGTRSFLDTSQQTITLDGDHDVVLAVFDSSGTQVAQTSLKAILYAGDNTTHNAGDNSVTEGLDDLATVIEDWLETVPGIPAGTPSVYFGDAVGDTTGPMTIDLGVNNLGLAFRDEKTTYDPSADPNYVPGDQDDAVISFNMDGDTDGGGQPYNDIDVAGFSNFLGLNDVYTAARQDWAWDSDIKASGWRTTLPADRDLTFTAWGDYDADSTTPDTLGQNTITVTPGSSLQDIADLINDDATLSNVFEAEIVTEGEGVRLRVKHRDGYDMAITQTDPAGSTDLINSLGLEVSNAGLSKDLTIKDEIVNNPSLISRGTMVLDGDTGEYSLSAGDNSTANALAEALRATHSFESAGQLPNTTRTLVDHAALTLSVNSTQASSNETRYDYQLSLVDTLSLKNAEISAVNLDEELAQLIIFEQSYSAAAKVIASTSEMFDVLNSIV
jgi:flagellar hook-associated protein 1 FlgK